ncbi:hypothetical protein B0H19DRAFT_1080285 [Mycena capillaripes]|nr:hypothetical protein B0H19DRAFT_1080285 [Mycena capillaripes]
MPKGKFTTHQNAHIESFMPDFVKELDRGLEGVPLTHWKQAKASHILESDLFTDLDMSEISRKGWFDMIVRKFTNYRNQVYRKSPGHETFSTAISSKRANPLLKFSSVLSGRELFAKTNSEFIDAATQQRVLDTGNKTHAAVYQTILKEEWDSLTGEQQSTWNTKAEEQASNIQQNQQEFAPTMTAALRDLCQGKLFGDAEMLLFYAFRQPDTGDLLAGTLEDLDLNYGQPWSEFAEEAIPRPIPINPSIPRNEDGQPVFPSVILDKIPVADLRNLLCEYFDQCWAHHLMGCQMKPLPWEEIISGPRKHCDADERLLQIKLAHPQDLTTVEVITLAQVLLSTSVIDSPKPFRFLEVQKTAPVVPTPPALPAPVSPSITDPVLPASEVPDSQPKPQDVQEDAGPVTHKRQRESEDAQGPTDAAAGSRASGGKRHKRAKTQQITGKRVEGDQAAQPLRRSSREKPTTNSTASVPKACKQIVNPEGGPRHVQDVRTPLSGKDMFLWISMETRVAEDGGDCEATARLSLSSSLKLKFESKKEYVVLDNQCLIMLNQGSALSSS